MARRSPRRCAGAGPRGRDLLPRGRAVPATSRTIPQAARTRRHDRDGVRRGGVAQSSGAHPSEQIRWVQFALNRAMGANLPVDGFVSADLRAALRDFQSRQGLPVSGFVGPDTIAALQGASGARQDEYDAAGELQPACASARQLDRKLTTSTPIGLATGYMRLPAAMGLYRITWPGGLYNGMATNLYARVQQHVKEAGQLGCSLARHRLTHAEMKNASPAMVRACEQQINDWYIGRPGVTNQRRELELFDPQ